MLPFILRVFPQETVAVWTIFTTIIATISGFPGYQAPEKFGIYYCPFCNTSFAFPKVDTKHIYENIYKGWDKRRHTFVGKWFVAKYLFQKIKQHHKCGKKGCILGVELKPLNTI
jgi:hypothetical protein